MRKAGDKARQQRDNDQRGKHDAQRGNNAAQNTLALLADKGGGIDGDDARRTLADGEIVRQLLVGGPALVLHHLTLQDGQHSHAAAKGHDAHLGKRQKQLQTLFQ